VRPVSTRFLETLRGSHKMFTRVRALTEFQTGVAPINGVELNVVGGSVSLDGDSDVRSSADIVIVGTNAFPVRSVDVITPYGNELFIERGIELSNGGVEIVSLGYFRIDTVEQNNAPYGSVRITAYDRMRGIIEARLTAPISFIAGTTIGSIFSQLVLEVYPSATIEFDDIAVQNAQLTATQVAEENRFEFLSNIATSYSKIMYWDYRGILVIKTPPNPTTSVWEVNAGAGGVLVEFTRSINRDGVYNAAVVLGESVNDTPPVRAIAYDNNRNSSTYWFGRFGKKPRFFSSSFITTYEQALNTARNLLQQTLGLPYSVNFSAIPNPALEPLDAITIDQIDIVSLHVIQTLVIPLTSTEPMSGTTKRQVDLALGT
jgi:hypothetical protein